MKNFNSTTANESITLSAMPVASENEKGSQASCTLNISNYLASNDDDPMVYVGTYRKYNEGSIYGKWISLSACGDYDTFYEVCREIHKDEDDPELMFQDFQGFPSSMYSECFGRETFEKIMDWYDHFTEKGEAFEVWFNLFNDEDFDKFDDDFLGKYESLEEYAEQLVDECYDLPEFAKTYFDYGKFARDLSYDSYYEDSGYVFYRH